MANTFNSMLYQNSPATRKWVDNADGHEVTGNYIGIANGSIVRPEWCEEILKPYLHQAFGQAVKNLLREDREDKIQERINMIQDEINELEMNVTVLKDEQDNLLEELKFIQKRSR